MNIEKIGFIGAGRMAQALAGGITKSLPQSVFVIVDPDSTAREKFRQKVAKASDELVRNKTTVASTTQSVFDQCELVFLATKPQMASAALTGLSVSNPVQNLIVSIMAGVTIDRIRELCAQQRIIRVMPNTPCLIGLGASAITSSAAVTNEEHTIVVKLFQNLGLVETVSESALDAVTGLSGSGPAYVFSFVESLIRGGVTAGLPEEVADRLAIQTVLGAASMLRELRLPPAELRSQVTSPGGTTLAGLAVLEKLGFDQAVIQAVVSAAVRSKELGQTENQTK